MDQQTIIAAMEARAKALGLSMLYVCERAGVHQTTFSRWKLSEQNPAPMDAKLGSINKIGEVLSRLEQDKAA